jgi:energy-coupling factor transport system ATP-binding protein
VLATHDLALARACANQILLLEDGRLTTLAPAELDAYAAERRMPSCEA